MEADGRGHVSFVACCGRERRCERQLGASRCVTVTTMNQSETVNDWPIDDASDSSICDFSTSDSEESHFATFAARSQLRPAGSALVFVPFADWDPERSCEGERTIRYNVEWELFVKNRGQAGESELDIVVSPRKFWKHILLPKLNDASANRPWKEDATKLVLSVTDRDRP